jgi:hypothetical protein
MTTLHTFGCSITQGFALPDVVEPITDQQGVPLTDQEIIRQGIQWSNMHRYEPSQYAWPAVLGDLMGVSVINHARRGACFNQIARQCAVGAKDIAPDDTVVVMWTYLSRISLQWPARTTVPLCNVVDPSWGFRTVILGFNKLFGLSPSHNSTELADQRIQQFIEKATLDTYMDPNSIYDRYHNNLVLQQMTDGFLRATGARVIHLSVEPQSYLQQLDTARQYLEPSLREPYTSIPDPQSWYTVDVDHSSCLVIHDPRIPPAENDMHPSVQHHSNFAEHIYQRYFSQRS